MHLKPFVNSSTYRRRAVHILAIVEVTHSIFAAKLLQVIPQARQEQIIKYTD